MPLPARKPRASTAVAPTLAPDETPSRYGSARGLRTSVWIAAPARPRPAPTTMARTTRGARSPHTIASSVRSDGARPVR